MCCRPIVSLKRSGIRSRRSPRRLGVWKRETRTCSGNLCNSGSSIVREFFLPKYRGEQKKKDRRFTPGKILCLPGRNRLPWAHICLRCPSKSARTPGTMASRRTSDQILLWTPTCLRTRLGRSGQQTSAILAPSTHSPSSPGNHTPPPPRGTTPLHSWRSYSG